MSVPASPSAWRGICSFLVGQWVYCSRRVCVLERVRACVLMRSRKRQRRLHYVSRHDVSLLLSSTHAHRHASISGVCQLLCCCIRTLDWKQERGQCHGNTDTLPVFCNFIFWLLFLFFRTWCGWCRWLQLRPFLIRMSRSLSSAILCRQGSRFAFFINTFFFVHVREIVQIHFSVDSIHASNYFLELALNRQLIISQSFIFSNEWLI